MSILRYDYITIFIFVKTQFWIWVRWARCGIIPPVAGDLFDREVPDAQTLAG